MKWSLRVLTLAGIGVYVHVTFLLLLIWFGWMGLAETRQWSGALENVALVVMVFVFVVLHELGHALMARRFGIGTKDITLLPIGGVARLERMPEEPRQELAVALAGPAVNVVLAVVLGGMLAVGAYFSSWEQMIEGGNGFLLRLFAVNIFMVVFNLLPAFPMDGGRVLRALLAARMTYVKATRIAAHIGQGMALLLGMVGLFGVFGGMNPFLILIAVFVWFGAGQESNMVQVKTALGSTRVDQIMITDFRTLAPEDTLGRAVEYLLAGYQEDFPVVSEGRVVGMLTRSALVAGLSRLGSNLPVADAMEREFTTARASELAETVLVRIQSARSRSLPVLEEGQLIGMITGENVGEFLMVQAALHNEPGAIPNVDPLAERRAT